MYMDVLIQHHLLGMRVILLRECSGVVRLLLLWSTIGITLYQTVFKVTYVCVRVCTHASAL